MNIQGILETKLDTENGNQLMLQLSEAEAAGFYVSQQYRQAKQTLAVARNKYLRPAEKGITELDRKIQLEAMCAKEQFAADTFEDWADLLKRRISLGQSMLRSLEAEARGGLR